MKKSEPPIKGIYVTVFDSKTFTFTSKRLKVIKECVNYVSLEDGERVSVSSIQGVYADSRSYDDWFKHSLATGQRVYSLKPISKEVKAFAKKHCIDVVRNDIEYERRNLSYALENLEEYKKSVIRAEQRVEESKNIIKEKEAHLAKLLKL